MNRVISEGALDLVSLPGMPEINDLNYYDDRFYLTNSMLGKLKDSPAHLQAYLDGHREENAAFTFGDAVHKGILEPDKWDEIIVWDETMFPEPDKTLRTKANKEWLEGFKQKHEGKLVLHSKDYKSASRMVESFREKPEAVACLDNAEVELIALCEIEGVPMKCKGDIVKVGETIIDIKTSSSPLLEDFKQSCEKYGYYRQAALYTHMFNAKNFVFLVIDKAAPHPVFHYRVSKEKMEQGWREAIDLINQFKYYFDKDDLFGDKIEQAVTFGEL
jgi:hypothetical protein